MSLSPRLHSFMILSHIEPRVTKRVEFNFKCSHEIFETLAHWSDKRKMKCDVRGREVESHFKPVFPPEIGEHVS